jgi:hypothetical protein
MAQTGHKVLVLGAQGVLGSVLNRDALPVRGGGHDAVVPSG